MPIASTQLLLQQQSRNELIERVNHIALSWQVLMKSVNSQ